MRIVQLNLASDPSLDDAQQLLESYHTLTGWGEALASSGATVRTVQRFASEAIVARNRVTYDFVRDGRPGTPRAWSIFPRVIEAVTSVSPEVIHINGLMFPGMLRALRRVSAPPPVIVLQDHSGTIPRRGRWPLGAARASRWREAFLDADACTFTARALAGRWEKLGLPDGLPVLEIPEASTRFVPTNPSEARERTGLAGDPAILWVGRLDANKDPLTVLTALDAALPSLPGARVMMIVPSGPAPIDVRGALDRSPVLRERVAVIGPVAHSDMPAYYSAADIFLSGSHHEGSGYALIEAMACGVVPCVTDIPAFRALTRGCGALWRAGDADACAAALRDVAALDRTSARAAVLRRFDDTLSWTAIGRQTFDSYANLIGGRRTTP